MLRKIEEYPRLGEVLKMYEERVFMQGFGESRSGAARTCLTLDDFAEYDGEEVPYFLYSSQRNIEKPVLDGYAIEKINYDGLDTLIAEFVNRRVMDKSDLVFRSRFAQKFHQIKNTYTIAYNAWTKFYEEGVNPIDGNIPLLSDYATVNKSEFLTTSSGSTLSKQGINNFNKSVTDNNITLNNVGNNSLKSKSETLNISDFDGNNDTTSNSKTTSNNENNGSSKVDTITTDSALNKQLYSDMPHSNVSLDVVSPEIGDINWKYATNMTNNDNKSKSVNNTISNDVNESNGITDNESKVNSSSKNKDILDGKTDFISSSDSKNDTVTKSLLSSTSDGNVQIEGLDQDNNSSKNTNDSLTVGYKGTQATVEAFLGSGFGNYFWRKLFNEFEDLFIPIYDSEFGALFTWKITADGVDII